MGIEYQGKTLKQLAKERQTLFRPTGRAYGIDRIELIENDPTTFTRFQRKLVAAWTDGDMGYDATVLGKLSSPNSPPHPHPNGALFACTSGEGLKTRHEFIERWQLSPDYSL